MAIEIDPTRIMDLFRDMNNIQNESVQGSQENQIARQIEQGNRGSIGIAAQNAYQRDQVDISDAKRMWAMRNTEARSVASNQPIESAEAAHDILNSVKSAMLVSPQNALKSQGSSGMEMLKSLFS